MHAKQQKRFGYSGCFLMYPVYQYYVAFVASHSCTFDSLCSNICLTVSSTVYLVNHWQNLNSRAMICSTSVNDATMMPLANKAGDKKFLTESLWDLVQVKYESANRSCNW